jgi:DNA-binding NtrC family response regulator
MTLRSSVLLIDAGVEPMELLAVRLRRLGYLVVRAKTTEEAHGAILDPRISVGAAVIPPDLPAANLPGALAALRRLTPSGRLPLLVNGTRRHAAEREALARAGVDWTLWEPVDAHTLRFQVNRALAGPLAERGGRRAARAPASAAVRLFLGRREREAHLYTLSSRGAYLATPAAALRNTPIEVDLPLPRTRLRLRARVVMTNVPGNLLRRNLPVGMAVRFEETSVASAAHLEMIVERRLRALEL